MGAVNVHQGCGNGKMYILNLYWGPTLPNFHENATLGKLMQLQFVIVIVMVIIFIMLIVIGIVISTRPKLVQHWGTKPLSVTSHGLKISIFLSVFSLFPNCSKHAYCGTFKVDGILLTASCFSNFCGMLKVQCRSIECTLVMNFPGGKRSHSKKIRA